MSYLCPARDAPTPTQSAVIVPVPAADPLVSEHRLHLDRAAGWGVPAHVTVLYPFMEPHQLDTHVIATLRTVAVGVASFDCRFVRARWFAEDALWLEPEPAKPFRQLTIGVWRAFPAYPPYGGAFADVVPHLTIGESRVGGLAAVQRAEVAVQPGLPVWARIDRALLIAGADAPNSWRVLHELPLAGA